MKVKLQHVYLLLVKLNNALHIRQVNMFCETILISYLLKIDNIIHNHLLRICERETRTKTTKFTVYQT